MSHSKIIWTKTDEAPLLAARLVTRTPAGGQLPPLAMRLATTRGTNALLERRGAPFVHFTTRGFEDLLEIGDQRRGPHVRSGPHPRNHAERVDSRDGQGPHRALRRSADPGITWRRLH